MRFASIDAAGESAMRWLLVNAGKPSPPLRRDWVSKMDVCASKGEAVAPVTVFAAFAKRRLPRMPFVATANWRSSSRLMSGLRCQRLVGLPSCPVTRRQLFAGSVPACCAVASRSSISVEGLNTENVPQNSYIAIARCSSERCCASCSSVNRGDVTLMPRSVV